MQSSPLEQLGLGRGDFLFLGWHSSLSILACLACTLAHGKRWLKTEQWEGEGLERSLVPPPASLPPPSPAQLSMPLFEEEGREVIPTFFLAYDFFFFFSLPGHRRGLLPEQADIVESHAAKLYSSWGENLLRIKPRPQSGLVLISLLFVPSDWRGASDYCLRLWRLTAISSVSGVNNNNNHNSNKNNDKNENNNNYYNNNNAFHWCLCWCCMTWLLK